MDKMNYPEGLIRYTTEHGVHGEKTKIFRPRVIIYGVILMAMMAGTFYAIAIRTPLALDVIRDRNTLFRETNEGMIENVYILKIMNMDKQQHDYSLSVTGISGLTMYTDAVDIEVESGEVIEVPVRLKVDPIELSKRSHEIIFNLIANNSDDLYVTEEARFIGPVPQRN
jgi:polyferredoxin